MKAEVVPYIIAKVMVDIPTQPTGACEEYKYDHTILKYPLDTQNWFCTIDFEGEDLPDGFEDRVDDLIAKVTPRLVSLAEETTKMYRAFNTEDEVVEELAKLDCGKIDGCPVLIRAWLAFRVYIPQE